MATKNSIKKRLFREFLPQDTKDIGKNYLRYIKKIRHNINKNYDISFSDAEFLMWGYGLVFFTIKYAAEDLEMNKGNVENRIIYPLVNKGYLYKYFDKLTPSQTYEDHLFRDETKYNYRVRYALTKKARLMVQRIYSQLQ
jgi:pyruvate/2-oxoacid:ferredoxin oxidoreductase alpha subunit|tara:strand:+ start:175 stop:594 length:420 start_codon:yes stop_codon:yes gene_type:complete